MAKEQLIKAELLIDAALFRAAQARAVKEGIQVEAIMEDALSAHLAERPARMPGEAAPEPALAR